MKKTTIVLGEETINTIQQMLDGMNVAELRKLASSKGLKNASKYKRVALVSALFDIVSDEYVRRLESETRIKKSNKSKKDSANRKNAPKGSNNKVNDDLAEVLDYLDGNIKNDNAEDVKNMLLSYGRQVLIRVMATMKIKGWYRVYNKYVMVDKIVEHMAA